MVSSRRHDTRSRLKLLKDDKVNMCTTIQTGLKPTSTASEFADYGNEQFAKKIFKKGK